MFELCLSQLALIFVQNVFSLLGGLLFWERFGLTLAFTRTDIPPTHSTPSCLFCLCLGKHWLCTFRPLQYCCVPRVIGLLPPKQLERTSSSSVKQHFIESPFLFMG